MGDSTLLTVSLNAIAAYLFGEGLTVALPMNSALVLVAISIVITVIGGLLPARKAAKKDPVVALRTD